MRISTTFLIGMLAALAPAIAAAKDDTPNPRQLAIDHPWYPSAPSITTIAINCGGQRDTFELQTDDRSWLHLIGSRVEVVVTPFGRFRKYGRRWRPIDDKVWPTEVSNGLSLRTLIGGPIIERTWTVGALRTPNGDAFEVDVTDDGGHKRTLFYDTLHAMWSGETSADGARKLTVTKRQRFGSRMFPRVIMFNAGCTLERIIKAGTPTMPTRPELERGQRLDHSSEPSRGLRDNPAE